MSIKAAETHTRYRKSYRALIVLQLSSNSDIQNEANFRWNLSDRRGGPGK